jgi:serine/threonine protein kinase
MLKMILFQLPDNFPSGVDPIPFILERQFSYFGDRTGVAGLIEHVGPDSPWQETFTEVMSRLIKKDNPPRPFIGWQDVEDAGFKDVVGRMTKLDPKQRITAREALEHPWFRDAL